MHAPTRPPSRLFRVAWSCVGLVLALSFVGLSAQMTIDAKLAPSVEKGNKAGEAAKPVADSGDELHEKLIASKDVVLDAEGIAKLQAAGAALKKAPIGGDTGLDAKIKEHLKEDPKEATKNSALRIAIAELTAALTEADTRRKPKADALATAEATKKTKTDELAALEKAEPRDEAKITAKKAELTMAEKAVTDAKAALDAEVPGYETAKTLRTQLNALVDRLKSLNEGDKKLRTAAGTYLTAAKRLSDTHRERITGTGFPALVSKPKDAETHGALAVQLPAFGKAEALNPAMKGAAAPLQSGNDFSKPAARTLASGLLPGDWSDETTRANAYLGNVVDTSNDCDNCATHFERFWMRMRDYAGEKGLEVGKTRDAVVKQIRDSLKNGTDPALDLATTFEALVPAKALVGDLRRADQDWPLLAKQLEARYETQIQKANDAVKGARAPREQLAQAILLLEESFAGNLDQFVSEQVRLFYFDNVPRLMQTLNSGTSILNTDGRVAVERAQKLQNKLLKNEQDLAEKLGRISDSQRKVVVVEEQIRLQTQKLQSKTKTAAGLKSTEAELKSKQVETAAEKAKKDADVARKEQAVMEAQAKKDANEPGAAEALVKAQAALADAKKAAAEAKADDDAAMQRVTNQGALVKPADDEKTEADNELKRLKGEKEGNDLNLKKLRTELSDLQAEVAGLRQSIVIQARIEAEAFGTARDNAPIYFAPANFRSTDPIKRVMMYAFADSKTLFVRGLPQDVEKTLDVVAGFDRPAPQARVTLWTMQLNSRDPNAINGRVRMINTELRHLRNNITTIQEVLRNSVNKEVNQVAQGMRNLTRGTALELEPRLNRYFYYPPEIRERLGFRPPYRAWWTTANQVLRLQGDLDDIGHLVETIRNLNYRIEKLKADKKEGSEEITGLRKDRDLLDEFVMAAFDEARQQSLPRVELWLTELKQLTQCSGGIEDLVLELQQAVLALKQLSHQVREGVERAHAARVAEGKRTPKERDDAYRKGYGPELASPPNSPVDSPVSPSDPSCGVSALPPDGAAARVPETKTASSKSERAAELKQALATRVTRVVTRGRQLRPNADFRDAFAVAAEHVGVLREGIRAIGELLPEREDGARESGDAKAPFRTSGSVRLRLQDLEYVTRWTIPDPAHSTTLGETMFVLTLGRRSSRLRVLRDFARELVNLSSRREAKADGANPDDRRAQKLRKDEYKRFLDDSLQVLRGLITGQEASGAFGSGNGDGTRLTAFPALPKVLFGALNARNAGLNDDEMTANQLEVLLAIQSKARHSVATEIRSLLKQTDRSLAWTGPTNRKKVDPSTPGAARVRDQYLPLLGWLSRSQLDSPSDFREAAADIAHDRCKVGPSYREYGAHAMHFFLDPQGHLRTVIGTPKREEWIQGDRIAWEMASNEGKRNTLTQATARVAAADEMIKRLMIITEDDLDHYFVAPTLRSLQDAIHDKPGTGTRIGEKIAGLFGGTAPRVNLGLIQRTSILATNRLVARVSPNASADIGLDGPQDFLQQAQQLGQLAQGVNNSFLAPDRTSKAVGAGVTGAMAANATNLAGNTSLGVIGAAMGLLSLLQEQPKEPPSEVYTLNTGDVFKVTPVFDPSGQALRFRFDHASTVRVREPNGTVNPAIPRVERHTVNTEVQLSNLEVREVSRFAVNAQLGLPEKRTGGIPFIRELPLVKDIPILGYFTRQAAKGGVVQESVILGQTAIYPSVAELVDLLVDAPRRPDVGDEPPTFLLEPNDDPKPAKAVDDPVKQAVAAAKKSEDNAKKSEDNAKKSEDNAKKSEDNAKKSEDNAKMGAAAPMNHVAPASQPHDFSGAAWVDGERFLVVHDTTKEGSAQLSLYDAQTLQLTPLKVNPIKPPIYDLECIARVPTKAGQPEESPVFLIVESGQEHRPRRVFSAQLSGGSEVTLELVGKLPDGIHNIEGSAAYWHGEDQMLLLGERGLNAAAGVVHKCHVKDGKITILESKPYAAPDLIDPCRRHITALEIDEHRRIFAASVSAKKSGPHHSQVRQIGEVSSDNKLKIAVDPKSPLLWRLAGFSVESLAIRIRDGVPELFAGTQDGDGESTFRRIAILPEPKPKPEEK